MVATGSKPPYGVRFLPEKSKGVAAPILLGPPLSCSDACGVRVSSLSCGLRFTIWVTPGNRLTKLRTSWPLCFTTGFPGSPNGVSPQFSLLNSKPVHKLGYTLIVKRHPRIVIGNNWLSEVTSQSSDLRFGTAFCATC